MASAGVQKEQSAQLEGVKQADAAAHGLEDGEHVKEGEESGFLDTKLVENGNVEAGKEEGLVAAATPAVVTDIEKKRRRAERFGTDLKISEAEKRKLRAARFNDGTKNGTTEAEVKTQTKGLDSPAKSLSAAAKSALIAAENAKRKARAERFGSIPQELKVAGESEVAAKPKLSQDEEAKKKARMARFTVAAK